MEKFCEPPVDLANWRPIFPVTTQVEQLGKSEFGRILLNVRSADAIKSAINGLQQ
jgi:hypothetical protein